MRIRTVNIEELTVIEDAILAALPTRVSGESMGR